MMKLHTDKMLDVPFMVLQQETRAAIVKSIVAALCFADVHGAYINTQETLKCT